MEKNLGHATAYGYAKSKGYSGTEEEFAELMADYASVGQSAAESAEQAAASAASASQSAATASEAAQTATDKASEAVTAAGTATTKASEASQSASTASAAATSASTSAQTATTSATTATTKASEASESATTASTAKTDAESARDAAAQSASQAAESARTLTIDATLKQAGQAADAKKTGDEIDGVKNGLTKNTTATRNINVYPLGRYQIDNNGVIKPGTDSMLGINGYISVEPETRYTITFYNSNTVLSGSRYIAFYKSDKTFISKLSIASDNPSGSFKTPELCGYICAYAYNGNGLPLTNNVHMQVELGNISTPYIKPESLLDAVSREISDNVEQMINISVPLVESDGYYTVTGSIANPTATQKEKYTQKIDCDIYQNIVCVNEFPEDHPMWCRYCTYDANGDLLNVYIAYIITASVVSFRFVPLTTEKYVSFSYRTYGESDCFTVNATINIGNTASLIPTIKDNVSKLQSANDRSILTASDLFKTKPCYDHLFVNTPPEYVTIPHESLYHVRLSKSFGFNYIEANIAITSDNVYVVNHFDNGKFGGYFHHIDGTTDISNTLVSSVSWDWIVQNVRYNSTIPKYRTRPARLEEFLGECKQQNIIPVVQVKESGVVTVADKIMGKGNYIAYGATRDDCPFSPIFIWASATSKESIMDICDTYGSPFIYGMANPDYFIDEQLKDIVNTLHDNGYWIGTSYNDNLWYKYANMGFDALGAIHQINRLEAGNICNYHTIYNFNNFTYTNATETDGTLVFTADGTLSPNVSTNTFEVCALDIEISFNGTISYSTKGEKTSQTITSDGAYPYFIAIPVINGNPKIDLSVSSGTIVTDIKFKASNF